VHDTSLGARRLSGEIAPGAQIPDKRSSDGNRDTKKRLIRASGFSFRAARRHPARTIGHPAIPSTKSHETGRYRSRPRQAQQSQSLRPPGATEDGTSGTSQRSSDQTVSQPHIAIAQRSPDRRHGPRARTTRGPADSSASPNAPRRHPHLAAKRQRSGAAEDPDLTNRPGASNHGHRLNRQRPKNEITTPETAITLLRKGSGELCSKTSSHIPQAHPLTRPIGRSQTSDTGAS